MLTKNIDESQAILVVAASDIGAYRRRGQKEGAKLIHKLIKSINFDTKICDYGELFLNHFSLDDTHKTIDSEIKKVKDFGKPIILIGGDHSTSYGCMKNFPEAQIYMFDAHPDLVDDKDIITHGSFLRHFKNRARLFGTRYRTEQEANEISGLKEIKTDKAYISIDIDVLDPSIMPGVSHPVKGGWSLEKLEEEVKKIFETKNVVCIDINEFSPLMESEKSLETIEKLLRFVFQKFLSR